MARRDKMKLGMSMRGLGYHPAAWRHPDVPADGTLRFEHYAHNAVMAERGLFDMIFFADGIGLRERDEPRGSLARSGYELVEMEPMTLLPALAVLTKHIGLVTTASTTYNEPFHVARKFATLDLISHGRAGWNIVTSWSEAEAKNFNREAHLDYDTRYERAAEFVEVVKGLWDCWEPGSLLYDKAGGLFYDEARMHLLNHRGKHFQVRGPLNVASMPQGRPVLFQAGASEPGREIAAATADVVYAAADSLKASKAYYDDVKARMAKHGRDGDALKIMPGVRTIVAATRAEAQDKFDRLQDLTDPLVGLGRVYAALGDLSSFDLDGPVPEPQRAAEVRSSTERMMERARSQNLTIRQLYQQVVGGGFYLIGTASDIVDGMQEWFEAEACDGFNVLPPYLPGCCDDFVEFITPELQRRGLFRTAYEGKTLRENLGLAPHVNRHVAARAASEAAE
ncbi:LLM class flavin-dependent oxidoreductase [Plastoroseomonas arctica]|uniref:LLM class flavin-dependent oxidoreductase n=1 Tax=Plastoroseomonas arctica TaxID=1509237 RepID=A0AAF1JX98_9PROT|nr:LLM class flavin-dependent oxidoreductase [Plastoroseomonas arctica]MBR0655502.1 LLM class flavin-dependent oxidoreductase [Plastoroseomonas arctica]